MRPYSVNRSWRFASVAGTLLLLLALAACRGLGSAASAAPTPIDGDAAVRLVLAQDDAFRGIEPRNPDLIGQAAWYEVLETDSGWRVSVRIGWGDCPAGCIDEHSWTYDVTTNGGVALTSESGPPLPVSGVRGTVTKGPICPVERDPPDPACAEPPVAGAELVIEDLSGTEVARLTTAVDGSFSADLAPGAYRLVPQPVEGLMGTAPPVEFRVEAGEAPADLQLSYDTGIR